MFKDKRQGDKPIPDNFNNLLNEDQFLSIRQLAGFGWEVSFVRRPLFQPLIIALHNATANKFGTLREDGSLDTDTDLQVRC